MLPVLMAPLVVRKEWKEWLSRCHVSSGPGWPVGGTWCERILPVAESSGGCDGERACSRSGFGPYPVLEGRARWWGSNEMHPKTWA